MKFTGNAGHSSVDPGAFDPIQPEEGDFIETKESDWVMDVMMEACKKLAEKGHEVQFVQDDSLENICLLSNEFKSDVFVSLHLNAAGSTEAQGPETFYLTGSTKGKKLADCVHKELVYNLGAEDRDRGVKTANFYVLLHTDAPAILIEAGFVTNVWEEATLNVQWVKDAVADSIVYGVLEYWEGGEKNG